MITCFSMSTFDWACFAFFPVGATFRYASNSFAASASLPRFKIRLPEHEVRLRVIRIGRHRPGEELLRLGEVVGVPGDDALVVQRVGAGAAAGARALAGLGAHRLRLREFLLVVVNRREEVVRVDRIGIDLQRLLQRRLGRRVVLLRGVVRPDVHVALRALGHLRDHLVELRDRLVVLAGVAQAGAFRVRRLQRFGARGGLGGLFLRHGPGVAPRLELEVHFRHVEADPRRERLLQPVLLGRDHVIPGGDADLDVVPAFLGLQRVLRPAVLVLDQ